MIIYLLVAIFPLVTGQVYSLWLIKNRENCLSQKEKVKIRLLFLGSIPMFLSMGLRGYYIGADTIQYIRSFNRAIIKQWPKIQYVKDGNEIGFSIFEKIIASITSNPTVYLCICSFIMISAVIFFGYRKCEDPFLFLFLHVTLGTYFFMMTGLRQGLAMSICLLSIGCVQRRRLLPFLALVFLAFTFHKSALLFLIVYFIAPMKVKWKNTLIYIIAIIVFVILFSSFQNWFNELVGYEYGIEQTGNAQIFFLIIVLIMVLSLIYKDNVLRLSQNNIILYNMSFVTLALWSARLVSRTAERPAYYFQFAIYALLAQTIVSIYNKKDKQFIYIMVVMLTMALFLYRMNGVSFKFFWQ